MAKAEDIYTEEELKLNVPLNMSLRDVFKIRSALSRRLKQRENYLPKMKRKGTAAHLVQMEENAINSMKQLIVDIDAALDEFDANHPK